MHVEPRVAQNLPSKLSAKFTLAHRLLRKSGFDHVLHANNISDGYFKVFFSPNTQKNARLGIITGKRNIPTAASRNRLKRVIREIFRQHHIKLCSLDLVVMIRRKGHHQHMDLADRLRALLNQVENQCVDL